MGSLQQYALLDKKDCRSQGAKLSGKESGVAFQLWSVLFGTRL